jgi:predicted nuclease of predicted toxin-antitoxin system
MKIKLDANLPVDLLPPLAEMGHDVRTADEEGLRSAPDDTIWLAAQREQRFLITQDLDFSDVRRFTPGTHNGVMVLRLKTPSRQALVDRVLALLREEEALSWGGCLVVASERKVRVRRPGDSPWPPLGWTPGVGGE